MNKKVLHFDLDTSFIKIKDILQNKDFIELEFKAISDEYPNNNKSHFPYDTFQKNISNGSFYNKPILGKFNNRTNNYETHIYKKRYDPEFDIEYYDYENGERPLGLIRESDSIRIEKGSDGLHWIVFNAVLWVKYNYKGVKKLLQSKNGKVSVEVTVIKSHKDENDIEIFDEWVFDGITILGYLPNTTVAAKTGINNAKLTIKELMGKQIFNNQLKTLCFAYEELNNDIKEGTTHLYKIENNKEMEGCRMSYDEKRKALETLLYTFVEEDSDIQVKDFDDSTVIFGVSDIFYKVAYSEEADHIIIDFENKEEYVEKEEPIDDEKECKMNDQNNECKLSETDEKNDECKLSQDSDVEECKMTDDEGCNKENCNLNEGNDTDNIKKTGEDPKEDDTEDDTEDDKDDDEDDNDSDIVDNECKTFVLNDCRFTGEELVDKYQKDMFAKNEAYNSLEQKYSELLIQKNELEEKVRTYELEKEKVRMSTLCEEVSNIAKKEGFNEDEVNLLLQKCKNKEFITVEDAVKEIAYIVFTKREQENIEKAVEFSAKVIEEKREQNRAKPRKSSFENLKDYVNK